MSLWFWVILASLACFAVKLAGYLVPASWLENARVRAVTTNLTIGLLAGLIVTSTITSGRELTLDARLVSLLAAAIALKFRAPFLLVVIIGAAAAALSRLILV
ncbi:MAG: AzlD domain-containing protein [Propionibacteriaceae bacterium]|jgi:hypothetical protein|nr:AzlD domain-containing protein [Propionibacteriaceae bacterium]